MKKPEELRSHRWFGRETMRSFNHRSRMAQLGLGEEDYRGKPVIAILNTWSEINPCHLHFRQRAEEIKRGVWQAGGFPLEMPAMSLAEIFMKPSPRSSSFNARCSSPNKSSSLNGSWSQYVSKS